MPDAALLITEISQRSVLRLKSLLLPSAAADDSALIPPDLGAKARLLKLGPGEWWLISDSSTGAQLKEGLCQHLQGRDIAVVDLTSGLRTVRIEGRATGDLLAKGCGLDLHSRYFPPGVATRTRFAHLAVTLECVDSTPRFELYVARSHFAWLREWLDDAAIEFRHPID